MPKKGRSSRALFQIAMAPRSTHLEEDDDQLHTIKKVSLEKSFEEVQQASFDRTNSHDLYSNFIPMSVEELQRQLTQHEKSLSTVSAVLTDGGNRLRERIQLLKELIPLKERESEIDRERAARTPGAAETRGTRPQDNTSPYDFVDEVENGSGRPRRTMSAHKASVQKQLDEHRKQQHHNFQLLPPQTGGRRRGKHMLAAAQALGADPSPAPKRDVFEQVMQRSAKGSGTKPSSYPGLGVDPRKSIFRRPMRGDTEWVPDDRRPGRLSNETNRAQQQAAHILSPGTTTRNRRKSAANAKPETIEILDSDNEEEDGSGELRGHQFEPSFRVSSRPTRSTVHLNVAQKIGEISTIYPREAKTRGSPRKGHAGGQKGTGTVEVTSRDLLTLEDNEFLNDSVIEFRIKKLWLEEMKQEDRDRCHVFNSFFFEKLSNADRINEFGDTAWEKQKAAHDRVSKWTRGVDIFKKDFVFFPIHASSHWSLVILCHPGKQKNGSISLLDNSYDDSGTEPTLLHLDSMSGGHNTKRTTAELRKYLAMEWLRVNPKEADKHTDAEDSLLHFNAKDMPHYRLKVPQQSNGSDCGVFLLEYLNRFAMKMPKQLTKEEIAAAFRNDSCPSSSALPQDFLRRDWFVSEESMVARPQIMLMILEELKTAIPELSGSADRNSNDERNNRIRAIEGVMEQVKDMITSRRVVVSDAEEVVLRRRQRAAAAKEEKRKERSREQERDRVVIDYGLEQKLPRRNDAHTRSAAIGSREGIPPERFYGKLDEATDAPGRRNAKDRRTNGRDIDLTSDMDDKKECDDGLGDSSDSGSEMAPKSDSDSEMAPTMIPSPKRDVHSDDEDWEKVKSSLTGTPTHQPNLRSAASGASAGGEYAPDPFSNRRKREGSDSPRDAYQWEGRSRRKSEPILEVEEITNTQDSIGQSVLSG